MTFFIELDLTRLQTVPVVGEFYSEVGYNFNFEKLNSKKKFQKKKLPNAMADPPPRAQPYAIRSLISIALLEM